MDKTRGMVIDGIIASEAVDSSGEILSVKGCDVSSMEIDGVLNYEHKSDTDTGASFNDIIGKCIKCKKIYSEDDCSNDRERMYWKECHLPFIYGQFRLFDEAGHPGALAAAAIVRDQHAAGEKLILRFSIEGSTLEKEGNLLKASIARRCALTAKPCNKTAITGLLKDSKSSLDTVVEEDAKKFEHPSFQHLGDGGAVVGVIGTDLAASLRASLDKLKKTQMAGGYNAAPGTLTGGAALQREHLHGVHDIAAIKSAVRDWAGEGGSGKLKGLLKHYLPEASDDFIDLFVQRADEWTVKKREAFLGKKEDKAPAFKLEPTQGEPMPAPATVSVKEGGGKQSKKRGNKRIDWDPETATLHTSTFSLSAYRPDGPLHQHYEEALKNPEVNHIHDEAMRHWVILHRLARQGVLEKHPDIIAHAALFSAMSPNTPVPIQEFAYAFLMDMKNKGWDPTKSLDPEQAKAWGDEFEKYTHGTMLPQWGRNHFEQRDSGIWLGGDQKDYKVNKETGEHEHVPRIHWTGATADDPNGAWEDRPKKAGERGDVGLAKQKIQGALSFADMHGLLAGLIATHGTDASAIAQHLNDTKAAATRDRQRLYNAARAGRTVESNIDPEDPDINGFAPKTIRYTLGMLGLGNVHVPDTHFIRHFFGLARGDVRNKQIKDVLWDSKNEHILRGIDDWYYNNHPAVAHTRQKLKEQYGEDFGRQALFPGFWLHWLTIEPHERLRNWDSKAKNAGTDHSVYFNSIYRLLDEYGIPYRGLAKGEMPGEGGASLASRCAHVMKALHDQHGETPAMLAYYAFLVPALLNNARSIKKAESLLARLYKAMEGEQAAEPPKEWKDGWVQPGVIRPNSNTQPGDFAFKFLGADESFHYVEHPNGERVVLPNNRIGSHYTVVSQPRKVAVNTVLDADKHALPGYAQHDEQRALVHGLDMSPSAVLDQQPKSNGINEAKSAFRKNASTGMISWVKGCDTEPFSSRGSGERKFSQAEREAAFYNLAKGYFGMGHYVPPTSVVKHPVTGELHSVQAALPNADHYSSSNPEHTTTLMNHGMTGEIDKLGAMDYILGQSDRHDGNYMMSENSPNLHLIDNGYAFAARPTHAGWRPGYLSEYNLLRNTNMRRFHPEAGRWLLGLDPNSLEQEMHKLSIPESYRKESVRRLAHMQSALRGAGPNNPEQWPLVWDLLENAGRPE